MNIAVYLKLEADYRAYAEIDPFTCKACGTCVKICPSNVPAMKQGKKVEISPEACQGCGACVLLCKTNSIRLKWTANSKVYSLPETESGGLRSPSDKNAVEAGLALRDRVGGKVVIIAAGPPRARESIKEALVMGADEGVLLCDPQFLGSDHMAAASILEKAWAKIGGGDLLIAPTHTSFAEPILVGAWLAERLGMAFMPSVRELIPDGKHLLARCIRGQAMLEFSLPLPAVVTVERGINEPRGLSLMAAGRAMEKTIPIWSASDLGLNENQTGEAGSQVCLMRVEALTRGKEKTRNPGEILRGSAEELAQNLIAHFRKWDLL